MLAAAVVALAGIAFGVLVGHHRALCFEHARAGIVFRSDQFDMIFLTPGFGSDRRGELRIEAFDTQIPGKHRQTLGEPDRIRMLPRCSTDVGVGLEAGNGEQGIGNGLKLPPSPRERGSSRAASCGLRRFCYSPFPTPRCLLPGPAIPWP